MVHGSLSCHLLNINKTHIHTYTSVWGPLTELGALARRLEQQPQLVEDQGHVHAVAAQALHAEQEGHGRLELGRQEQHLEVQEGLLAGREVGLPWWRKWRPGAEMR